MLGSRRSNPTPRSATAARTPGEPPRTDDAAMQPGPLWAVITGQAAGTNRYSWTQIDEGDIAAFDAGLSDDFAAQGTSDQAGYPAYEINGRTDVPTDGTVRVQVWPAGDLTYVVFTYPGQGTGGSGTSAGCNGFGWVAALTDTFCLSVTLDGVLSDLILTSGDGLTWTSADTIAICGLDYTVSFVKGSGCEAPCLSITTGATTYTGARDCGGCNYAVFAYPTEALCPDTDLTGKIGCQRVTKLRVDWSDCAGIATVCCPDDGLPAALFLTITPPPNPGCACMAYTIPLAYTEYLSGVFGWVGEILTADYPAACNNDSGRMAWRLTPLGPLGSSCWQLELNDAPTPGDYTWTTNQATIFTGALDSCNPVSWSGSYSLTGSSRPCLAPGGNGTFTITA